MEVKQVKLSDGKCKVTMRDVSGNHTAQHLVHLFCDQADCVLLCYDMTSRNSFEQLSTWYEEVKGDQRGKKLPIVLLALK
mmetsp:Transcript_9510/g.11730  ORF Transcript_9510/g.11730 Transcript_9510/m.11730 type:complete len:80 (-) Transcript_9510:270-509(-)|eukprot:CAMPEP_0170459798 /NCGR_PEP_ID=MMETSP0123-20130129/6362_1 /TAXON_ID=182087 /ORGANISM="Favella ehrenbergii, Strain Fehren 1" /LENGTH=79 /DNA_ID=CAMNT_0010724495 /DNA_START=180 /DNA_END=419 /DNA_ORIENTATION=+